MGLSFPRLALTLPLVAAVTVLPAHSQTPAPKDPPAPDFTSEVRPLLARYCFKCHGPDEKTRKAKMRLDLPDTPDGVIVPGRPGESELIARVSSTDPDTVMPPPSTKMALTAAQKDLLKRWVASGAKFERHWAFVPPKAAPAPAVKLTSWPRNPIDHFVLDRLEARDLKPSPPANRHTLIRRLSLDLIGLPPTPAEVEAFVNDPAPDAYEKLVDRLLQSPRYGERWARRWLDLARYADTNGYEKDRARIIWPYRDWVIRALNADMPFDRFTIEQLAGDLLPNATPEQVVATGFHRNTMVNEEGGIDPLEFRYYAVVDRVNTTATTWLGLTMGCALCHSHKYDPISQVEYYRLLAFFNNADEPDYAIPDSEVARRRADVEETMAQQTAKLSERFPGGQAALEKAFAAWQERESAKAVAWTVVRPSALKASMPYLRLLEDGSVLAGGDQTKSDTYELHFADKIKGVTALRLEVLPHESLPAGGPGRAYYEGPKGDFFLSELALTVNGQAAKFGGASQDYAKGGFGAAKVGAAYCFDNDAATGWSTTDQPGKPHEAVFNFTQPVDLGGDAVIRMLFERHYACGLGRFRISVTTDARRAEATGHGAAVEAIVAKAAKERTADEVRQLLERFLQVAPELANARKEIDQLRATLPAYQTTLVMKERPPAFPRPTHLHHRGEFLQPKERVEPGAPSALHGFPAGAPRDRLSFARWLVSPDNPLTARVTMNRQWQAFFGRGLVRTLEDFGLQGETPTHPELLDWLALEFMRQGWSLKKMHRLIVTSATYRQASRVTPELLARDPDNRWLARAPRVRLEAESIRDSLLQVSGLLSAKIGGPSVFPPQPASVTKEGVYGAIEWKVSTGADRYRRGLYTFLKRSIPYAMFATFDGVTGETCLARREVSNTPLQALTMLNDLVVIEAAQALGRTLAEAPGSVEERMAELFGRCLARPPTAAERQALVGFYHAQHKRLQAGTLDAGAIAGGKDGNAVERAAWTLTARAVLNLDEMITRE
jgi:hypothetical protein